jgi:hypothetical protein
VARRGGYTFVLALSEVDADVLGRLAGDDDDGEDAGGGPEEFSVVTYPAPPRGGKSSSRSGCLELAAAMASVHPLRAVARYVRVGVEHCGALLSSDLVRRRLLGNQGGEGGDRGALDVSVLLGDFTWPCSSLLADAIDQTRREREQKEVLRVLFLGNLSVDPVGEHYGLPSPASEVPGMGLAPALLLGGRGGQGSHEQQRPLPVHHRALNLAFREVSRILVRLVMLRPYGALRRRHLPDDPRSFLEAAHDAASLVLVPLVWGVEPPRALPPNWQPIPPVLPGPARPLPPDLQRWIDEHCGGDGGDGSAARGLVLVAFGTQATLSETAAQKMARAMSELSDEFCFVWKIDPATAGELLGAIGGGGSDRILAVPWVPQNDVLGHPRTAAFVSHAGYGSLYEAAYHGVPVVAVPQFGDQPDNAVRPVLGGWGSALFDKEGFGAGELAAAVRLAPSLRPRAQEVSALVRRAGSGPERAADWIEYAVEHGVGHLVPFRSIKASYLAYYNLDAALLLLLLALGAAAGMRSCVRSCRSSHRDGVGGASSGSRGKEKRS